MNAKHIVKYSVAMGALFGLVACGSPDPAAPAPQLLNGVVAGLVSPYDSIAVEFSENIPAIASSQVTSEMPIKIIPASTASGKKYWLVGDSIPSQGVSLLLPDTTYTVTFMDLENDDGKVQSQNQILSFKTMPILDRDFSLDSLKHVLDNNEPRDAEILGDSVKFFNGRKLVDGISLAGYIQGETKAQLNDDVDWYTVWLYATDSLYLNLSGMREDLDLEFMGPANSKGDLYNGSDISISNVQGTASESVALNISFNMQYFGVDSSKSHMDVPLQYWIGVKQGKDFQVKSPYVLQMRKKSQN